MFEDISCATAFQTYVIETAPVLALRLDQKCRVVEANAEAQRVLGDIVNRSLTEKVADCSCSRILREFVPDGKVSPLTINTASGVPETLYFRFFDLPEGVLALGAPNLAEQQKIYRQFRAMNAELDALTRQLHRANAELRASDSLHTRQTKEMRDYSESLRQQSLASLNLMEDAIEERKRVEQANLALRQSEAQFRSLVEGAPDAILVLTNPGIIAYVNPACCRMLGVDTPDQLLNRYASSHVDPSFHELHGKRMHGLFVGRIAAPTVNQTWIKSDGTRFPVGVSSVPITYRGQPAALSFARDLSERVKEQQRSKELEIAAAKAEAASQAKSAFLSTMSHEIRTPMNAILGYTQLILRDPNLGSETAANLKVISRSGEHLLNIINDVLDMAKIEAGHLKVVPKTFNLPSLLHHLEAIFRLQAAANGVEFVVHVSGEPVEYVVADEGKIRQVLINLLGNAVKFTQRGRIELRAALNDRADERLWLSIEVEDSGIGMTAEEQENLFQPFIQGERGQNLHHGGTGLGLAICRGMATAMGGEIGVASRPGSGSTFHFEIPVERGIQRDCNEQPGHRGRVLGIQAGKDAPRILIADDMRDNREWLSKLLQLMGFAVRSAENGEVAVQVWKEWLPQLVLMDIHMPVMNGFEATRSIRSAPDGEHTIIVILTADAMEEERADALASGVDGFISKPCRDDDLLQTICGHLGLTYSYGDETVAHNEPAAVAVGSDELGSQPPEVPADLVAQMLHAVTHGDKRLLDSLVLAIEDRGDVESAAKLRAMANRYQYDRLIDLLENS